MILPGCTIKPASKPENGERLCWNVVCRRPLPKFARKWCEKCPYGSDYYVQHHIGSSRLMAIRAARIRLDKDNQRHWYGLLSECTICHSLTDDPEVDHLVPMGGDDRSKEDCRHHVANLRVLCSDCHKEVSAVQAKARAAARKGNAQMELL